ncbi:unnamed protein product [Acidithrix sp. C25]|nr:unnamed protein product [Acidithrix sp. C25]
MALINKNKNSKKQPFKGAAVRRSKKTAKPSKRFPYLESFSVEIV